jgi:hypothetical protein
VGNSTHLEDLVPPDATLPGRGLPAAAHLAPVLLWCAGIAAMVALTGGAAWPLALGWAAAGLLLAVAWRALAGRPAARAWLCAALAAVLVLLTWEGGLFLAPAVVALLLRTRR